MKPMRTSVVLAVVLVLGLARAWSWAEGLPEPARSRVAAVEELFAGVGPSVSLGTVYRSLPPPARQALLAKVREMVLAQLPPGLESAEALAGLPARLRAKLGGILALVRAVTPEQLDGLVGKLDLDHLAPLPAEVFKLYHAQVAGQVGPTGRTRAEQVAADRADPAAWLDEARRAPGFLSRQGAGPAALELLAAGDRVEAAEVPVRAVKPAFGGLGVEPSIPIAAPPHVLVNSVRLAAALNRLADPGASLEYRAAGRTGRARDGVELVNGLLATGRYDLAVFDARMFVDFVGLAVPQGDALVPVRIPTWFDTGIRAGGAGRKGEPLILPGNHSEHLLGIFEKGGATPVALVKWYMGIPDASAGQGTLFKAAVWQKSSWSGFRVVRTYQAKDAVRQMVQAAGQLMRLFNFMQGRFAFARNGYGVLGVCNDTTGLMEGVLQGATGGSTVWPLIRDPRLDFYYADAVGRLRLGLVAGAGGEDVLGIPSDSRPDHYPWVGEVPVLLYRIGANLPFRDPAGLHFPELRGALAGLRDAHPQFARGLGLASLDGGR